MAYPTWCDQSTSEAASRYLEQHLERVAPHAAEPGRAGQIGHVAAEGAQVAQVTRDPLQLQGNTAHPLRVERDVRSRQPFQRGAGRGGMPHGSVSREGLSEGEAPRGTAPHEERFGAPVLVAEADLQMEHPFAVALEAEVPGLDDPGV